MFKRIFLFCSTALLPLTLYASILHPVISIGYGLDAVHTNSTNQNFTLQAPFFDTYLGSGQTLHGGIANIFLGLETPLYENFSGQIGLSYYKPQTITIKGTIWQFGNPIYNNKDYQSKVESHQFLIEAKLLTIIHTQYPLRPYIVAGFGKSFNKSYDYSESPLAPFVVVNPASFANHSSCSSTYVIGLGVDMDVSAHFRVGASYRQTKLGDTNLGLMPGQADSNVLSYNTLRTDEILFNLSYII